MSNLPHPNITPIPNTEPDAVPDLWNSRYDEIDANFNALDQRAQSVETEITEAKGDSPSFAIRMNQVAQAVQDLGGDLGNLQGMTAPMLAKAVRINWDYSGNNISMEMWAGDYTLMDTEPVQVISAIAGDDSIDVSSTETFTAGQHYSIYDGNHIEQVLVDAILTENRIRITNHLAYSYSGETAFLSRTSIGIEAGKGVAKNGDVYFSKPIILGFDDKTRAVVIRRQPSDAIINVDFLSPTGQWVSAPLAWTRSGGKVPAGMIDCEYEFNVAGETALRVTVLDDEDEDTQILHIVGLGKTTGLRGEHTPPLQPTMQKPLDGATDLTDRPTLALSNYVSLTNTPVAAVQFQISDSDDFEEVIIDSGAREGGLSWRETGLRLETSTTYYVRGRARDAEGAWSQYSDPVSFTTADSFVYIQAPTNQGPANNLTDVSDTPTLQSSSFDVYAGSDSHVASQWQIRKSGEDYDNPVFDSGVDESNLEDLVLPEEILQSGETSYYFRVRHQGDSIGWSDWSVETKFTTKKTFGSVIGIALVTTGGGSGTWVRIDEDGNQKETDQAFFDNHPTYQAITDQTIDDQLMVRIKAFYSKNDVIRSGDLVGKKAIWVSDKKEVGFERDPAFYEAGEPLDQYWLGKYKASNGTGNVMQSVPGVSPLVNINFATMLARATARNTGGVTGFGMMSVHRLSAVKKLALIELGNPDVQSLIAQGHSNGSAAQAVDAAATLAASWRGIIGLWGNVWEMFDGLQTDVSRKYKVWDDKGNKNYITTNQVAPTASAHYIVTMSTDKGEGYDLNGMFLPESVDSSLANSTYADGFWSNANCVAYHGGSWGNAALDGLFCLNVSNAASNSHTSLGSRLEKV